MDNFPWQENANYAKQGNKDAVSGISSLRLDKMPLCLVYFESGSTPFSQFKSKQSRHLTVLHLVPHTTCLWLSHWEANTLLSRPRENSLSLRMLGSLPAAKPRRLLWSLSSCCCWGLNSRPRRAHTTECRLHHHCWAWRDEQETRPRLCGVWHQPSWRKGMVTKRWNAVVALRKSRTYSGIILKSKRFIIQRSFNFLKTE